MISHFQLSRGEAARLRSHRRTRTVPDEPAARHSDFSDAANATPSSADDRQHRRDHSSDHPDVDIVLYGPGGIGSRRSAFWEVLENGRARSALQAPLGHRPGHSLADAPAAEARVRLLHSWIYKRRPAGQRRWRRKVDGYRRFERRARGMG